MVGRGDDHGLDVLALHQLAVVGDGFDLAADLLAVGIDPNRSVLYLQSKVPEVAELTLLLSMVTPLSWVQRVPTFKEMAKKHPDNVNLGLFSYPVLQGADVLMVKGVGVPVGKDQLAHLELVREVTRRFNRIYAPVFPEPQALLTETPLVKGTDGKQRMSKTVGNIVGVTDEPEVLRKQVLYKLFFDDWEHYWELCRKAQIGCYDKKKLLAERLIEMFRPFREVRAELSPEGVNAILEDGSLKAREVARQTLVEARRAVGLPPYLDR